MEQYTPGFFGRIASTVMRYPARSLFLLGLVCLLSAALASLLRVDPNILDLLPADDPTTEAIQRLNAEEGGANLVTIAIAGDDPQALDDLMVDLSEQLSGLDGVDYVLYALDPDLSWKLGMLQLSVEELQLIRGKLQGALALGPGVANPLIAGRLLALGPLTDKLANADATTLTRSEDGVAQLLLRPTGSAYDQDFARPFMAKVNATIDALNLQARGMELVWIGGAYRHGTEEVEGIIHDLSRTALLSFVLVVGFVGISFRDARAVLLIFVPLLIGNLMTWGMAGVVVGTVNSFTSFFTAILIGLGVDFSIHLYARYREERLTSDTLEEAVVRAWDATGPPCATAALTSAGGFCALWVAGFAGFQQLGTLLAGGVLLCLAAVLVTLPLLILWREKGTTKVPLRQVKIRPRTRPPTYRFAPLGLLVFAAITLAAATALPSIEFEYDLSELRRDGGAFSDLTERQQRMVEDSYAPVIISYDDADSLKADYIRLNAAIDSGALSTIQRILSLHTLLPTDQEARVALLQEIAALSASDNVRYLPRSLQDNLARIARADPVVMGVDDLPRGLQHVLGANDGHHRLLLIPHGNMWDLRENQRLFDEVEALLPDQPAAGEFLASAVLYQLLKRDAPRVTALAMLLIFVWTLIDLRGLGRAMGAVMAVTAGLCWAGAGMVALDLKVSLVNFAGIPILMGIGIDVVIHLLHRLEEEGPGRVRYTLMTTGWASFLSTTTTILSFAALHIASNQGVRSLGTMIVMGLTLVTLAAVATMTLGWMTTWKMRGELPDSLPEADASRRASPRRASQ